LADHVSRDNTPLRNIDIVRLTERISVTHRYSWRLFELCVGKAYAVSEMASGLYHYQYIPDDKLGSVQSILGLVSDPDGDWYLSNSAPVGEYLSLPSDAEVNGDNDVNQ
jgi:hypothetical protein